MSIVQRGLYRSFYLMEVFYTWCKQVWLVQGCQCSVLVLKFSLQGWTKHLVWASAAWCWRIRTAKPSPNKPSCCCERNVDEREKNTQSKYLFSGLNSDTWTLQPLTVVTSDALRTTLSKVDSHGKTFLLLWTKCWWKGKNRQSKYLSNGHFSEAWARHHALHSESLKSSYSLNSRWQPDSSSQLTSSMHTHMIIHESTMLNTYK